jgi:hypothetical protein
MLSSFLRRCAAPALRAPSVFAAGGGVRHAGLVASGLAPSAGDDVAGGGAGGASPSGAPSAEAAARLANGAIRKGGHTLHPERSLPAAAAAAAARGVAGLTRTSAPPVARYQLSVSERAQVSASRRRGWLPSGNSSTDAARASAYHEAALRRRPYICVDRDGSAVYVDALPAAGVGARRDMAPVLAVLARLRAALADAVAGAAPAAAGASSPSPAARAAGRDLQLVTADALLEQAQRLAVGPLEGSNAHKTGEAALPAALPPAFYVFTRGKAQARALAERLAAAAAPPGAPPPAAAAAARAAERLATRRARRAAQTQRKLRKLIADPERMRTLRVRAGVLDGYIEQEAKADAAAQAARAAAAAAVGERAGSAAAETRS